MAKTNEASANAGSGDLLAGDPGLYSSFGPPAQENPDAPGFEWTDTSKAAADAIAPKLGRLQRLAFNAIKARGSIGLTADELADVLGLDRYSAQPRSSELRRKGLIVDSGMRRHNTSGKRAIVWTFPHFQVTP